MRSRGENQLSHIMGRACTDHRAPPAHDSPIRKHRGCRLQNLCEVASCLRSRSVLCVAFASQAWPQQLPSVAARFANSTMARLPAGHYYTNAKWSGTFFWPTQSTELAPTSGAAHSANRYLDAWFNSQQRQNAAGQKEYFHYKWNDYSDSGFSLFGQIFSQATTHSSIPCISSNV